MKNFIYTILLLSSFQLASCSDDFLDIPPETKIASANFWQTEADANGALIGCYDALQPDSYFGFDQFVFGDVRSDNCFAGGDKADNFEIDNFSIRTTNSTITRYWKQLYKGIARANTAIARIGLMDTAIFEEGKKDALLGEAHFLRSLSYFYLVQLFGDVPLSLDEVVDLAGGIPLLPRDPETKVYNQIIIDLETSISLLEGKNQDSGRVNVGSAQSLLAKVHLTLKNYDEVIALTDGVMSRGYKILDNFDSLFDQTNKNNEEVIFAVRYSNGNEDGNVFPELVLPTPESAFGFTKFNAPTEDSRNQFEDGDLRESSSLADRNGILYLFKWRNGAAFDSADYNIVLRYADVLLMRAEALNMKNRTDEAIDLLNQIRNRAGLDNYAGETTQIVLDAAIFQERRVELMYEGHRWFDLKRKGFAFARDAIQKAKGMTIEEFQMVLPIPQEERDKNKLLDQNPMY